MSAIQSAINKLKVQGDDNNNLLFGNTSNNRVVMKSSLDDSLVDAMYFFPNICISKAQRAFVQGNQQQLEFLRNYRNRSKETP